MSVDKVQLEKLRILADEESRRKSALVRLPELEAQHKREQDAAALTDQLEQARAELAAVVAAYQIELGSSNRELASLVDRVDRFIAGRRDLARDLLDVAQRCGQLSYQLDYLGKPDTPALARSDVRGRAEQELIDRNAWPPGRFNAGELSPEAKAVVAALARFVRISIPTTGL